MSAQGLPGMPLRQGGFLAEGPGCPASPGRAPGAQAWIGRSPPRPGQLMLVMAAHLLAFWGLWQVVADKPASRIVPVSLLMTLAPVRAVELPRPRPQVVPQPLPRQRPRPDSPPPGVPVAEGPAASPWVQPQAADTMPAEQAMPPAASAPPAPAKAPTPSPARIELPSSSADYLSNPAPVYPPASKRQREQGRVLLRILVDDRGLPLKIELKASSGFNRLDEAALVAVQKWKFVPGRRNGVAEPMWVEVPIEFRLQG